MKVRLKRLSYIQNIKLVAFLYFLMGIGIYVPLGIINIVLGDPEGWFLLSMSLLFPLMAVVMIPIAHGVYNVVAGWIGGFEFTLEEIDKPDPT